MANFLLTFNGIMPIVCLIAFGYFLKKTKFLSPEGFKQIDKLCFKYLVPIMLFHNIYTANLSEILNWNVILFMEIALASVFLFSMLVVPFITKDPDGKATVVHGLGHGNLAVMGIPLISSMFGASEVALYTVMVAASSPLVNGFMVYEHTHYDNKHVNFAGLLKKIFSSPYLLATLTGLALNLIGVKFPAFFLTAVSNAKSIASPLCLISMGGAFEFAGFKKYHKEVIWTCLLKCVLIPAAILPAAALIGFRGAPMLALTIIFTCPSAVATYSYSVGMCGDPECASQIVVYTTVFSIFTIFAWIFTMLQLGLF
ncbi:MAG: AEC family transporter [Erysipelotrichales bacterium]|nr:AEC family transporter [Erysipelotrichales bacterium]